MGELSSSIYVIELVWLRLFVIQNYKKCLNLLKKSETNIAFLYMERLENNCGSNPLDANDAPTDLDGDTICDMMDTDIDGDGLNNTVETNTGIYISSEDSGSDPLNPDTDGDGFCDGPVSPNYSDCIAGPDAFPTDASAHLDTDGDGNPDTITGNSTTGLVEDLDDDNDGASDLAEADCGTDPVDASETCTSPSMP